MLKLSFLLDIKVDIRQWDIPVSGKYDVTTSLDRGSFCAVIGPNAQMKWLERMESKSLWELGIGNCF